MKKALGDDGAISNFLEETFSLEPIASQQTNGQTSRQRRTKGEEPGINKSHLETSKSQKAVHICCILRVALCM